MDSLKDITNSVGQTINKRTSSPSDKSYTWPSKKLKKDSENLQNPNFWVQDFNNGNVHSMSKFLSCFNKLK